MDHGEPISVRVVERVADHHDVDPLALEPRLHAVVDPDALDELFAGRDRGEGRSIGTVEFEYCNCTVTVDSKGRIDVKQNTRAVGRDEPVSRR